MAEIVTRETRIKYIIVALAKMAGGFSYSCFRVFVVMEKEGGMEESAYNRKQW